MLAGKIMLENGAETYRVEDTMIRIAASYGMPNAHSFVTPTGIIFSLGGMDTQASLMRISERSTDLRKVVLANDISRRIGRGEMSAGEAYERLSEVDGSSAGYPFWIRLLVAAVASGCFLLMFEGSRPDFVPAMVCGGAGYAALNRIPRYIPIKLFSEFSAALAVGVLACLLVRSGLGHSLDKIVIGSIMPLVPGLLITNAVRDLMAGHFVSGLSKGAEAFLTAFAIGSGIAIVLSFFGGEGIA
ncbi:threonine/serine exporter family protein [Cohnella xylanilytica]|uniref:Threonine/serine exporter family protein n=2 Tax=Cohnella xylanilytica TaxID=557555 RepID=A0A841TYU8_9BACL|nr:threonine/serine exporter family protein [Cohnella xylanilytica]MBB6693727.1 threonine/serine exporter family protein [Cohnella xylanilytica]